MDEDSMWKSMYQKLQQQKSVDQIEHDSKIQEIDDSFFEKFGSILRQKSVELYDAKQLTTPHNPDHLPSVVESELENEEQAKDGEESQVEGEGSPTGLRSRNGETDSGNETLLDTDSEEDDPEKMDLYVEAVGWNIDELYSEILYEILHNVGCDVSLEIGQLALLSYVQDAFKIANDKHQQLLAEAEAKQPPEIVLNVEIIEAKDIQPKDPNGLSDPFVTIYLTSNASHRFNTSVKYTTLSPKWEEHFSLPISENPAEDTLCIEVWDFDPAETVKEKMTKIFEVKGVKGLRKLMKEIAITASTGKHDNELVGRAHIPLKTIPASGMTMWYSLDKKNKLRRQGVVKVRLAFSSQKNSQVATQEHRHLLRMLLLHELESSKVTPYWWCGSYSAQAEAIITQHAAQSGLGQNENNLAQWTVYCAIHGDHPLSFALFDSILGKLIKPIQSGAICDEETKLFWDGVRKLLPSCFGAIRRIRKKTAGDKNVMKMLKDLLHILYTFSTIDIPENVDLFPQSIYGWLRRNEDETRCNIKEVLSQACTQGASDWFVHILQNNECKDTSEEGSLQHLIRVIQLVRSDLQRAVEFYDKLFLEIMNLPYAKTLYCLYESKISSLVEPIVTEVCKRLKRLRFNEDIGQSQVRLADELNGGTAMGLTTVEGEPMSMGTTLFELYLVLQRFLTLGQGLCPADWNSFTITSFHSWFFGGVAQWLDIAVYKALTRIEKAVELDQLVPVDATVKYSSSAVDTLAIFYQIKIFWQQLAWPDVEGCYTFVAKIIDDICRCSVFYADKMSQKVDGLGMISNIYENKFQVTTEWCLAINNIDYVRQSLQPFVSELGMDDIISRLCELRSALEAQRCKETLQNVIENAIDTVKNKIIELLEKVVKKMMPSITRFLVEGAELLHQDCTSMERVMLYLEDNLDTLYKNLNQDNFTRTLDIVWEQLSNVLYQLIQSNLEKRRPPSFFANLHQCVKIMVKSFKQDNINDHSCETLQRIEYLLKLNGFETAELIHQYHLERWQEQQSLEESTYGMLTVRAHFIEGDLKIEVINARNLAPMDSNGLCDSFVRIHLLPEDVFATAVKPKTQTHNKNVFPLYDEMFIISLTSEQRNCKDGLIAFIVKDKDLFGMSNQLIGEGYMHFSDIPDTPVDIVTLPQIHIILSRPTKLGSDSVKALEHRQGDKQAKEFLKKQRQKMSSS